MLEFQFFFLDKRKTYGQPRHNCSGLKRHLHVWIWDALCAAFLHCVFVLHFFTAFFVLHFCTAFLHCVFALRFWTAFLYCIFALRFCTAFLYFRRHSLYILVDFQRAKTHYIIALGNKKCEWTLKSLIYCHLWY